MDGVFNGQLRCVIIQCVTDWYRRTIFTPFQLLKKIDKSNHVLSLCGIELLRSMIPGEKNKHDNLFPSSSAIQKVATIVSARGKQVVPYELKYLPTCYGGAELVEWDTTVAIKLVLEATGLKELAKKEHIELGAGIDGIDGTKLWNGCNIIISGIKKNSLDAYLPISKVKNLIVDDDGKVHSNVQSPENQIILKMAIGSETKKHATRRIH